VLAVSSPRLIDGVGNVRHGSTRRYSNTAIETKTRLGFEYCRPDSDYKTQVDTQEMINLTGVGALHGVERQKLSFSPNRLERGNPSSITQREATSF
jgi:hypothetical protein